MNSISKTIISFQVRFESISIKMLLLKAVLSFVFIFFSIFHTEAQMVSSALAKARRTQSMKPLSYEIRSNVQPTGSSSATLTLERQHNQKTQPLASTSADATASIMKEEANHFEKPMKTSGIQKVGSFSSINLEEALRATNSEILDPARDGVYARVRNAIRNQISNVAIGTASGSAIGAAGFQLSHIFTQLIQNTTTTAKPTTTTTVSKIDPDGITNNI